MCRGQILWELRNSDSESFGEITSEAQKPTAFCSSNSCAKIPLKPNKIDYYEYDYIEAMVEYNFKLSRLYKVPNIKLGRLIQSGSIKKKLECPFCHNSLFYSKVYSPYKGVENGDVHY